VRCQREENKRQAREWWKKNGKWRKYVREERKAKG
jgi:hypothetical protein